MIYRLIHRKQRKQKKWAVRKDLFQVYANFRKFGGQFQVKFPFLVLFSYTDLYAQAV